MSVVLLGLLAHTLLKLPALSWIMPWLTAVGVFYWALFRPNKFFLGEAFIIGILEDIVVGTPLGFHAAGLVLLHWLAQTQVHGLAERSFLMIWTTFGFMLAVTLAVLSAILWIAGVPFTLWVAASWLTTSLIFPIVYAGLAWSHLKLTMGR